MQGFFFKRILYNHGARIHAKPWRMHGLSAGMQPMGQTASITRWSAGCKVDETHTPHRTYTPLNEPHAQTISPPAAPHELKNRLSSGSSTADGECRSARPAAPGALFTPPRAAGARAAPRGGAPAAGCLRPPAGLPPAAAVGTSSTPAPTSVS